MIKSNKVSIKFRYTGSRKVIDTLLLCQYLHRVWPYQEYYAMKIHENPDLRSTHLRDTFYHWKINDKKTTPKLYHDKRLIKPSVWVLVLKVVQMWENCCYKVWKRFFGNDFLGLTVLLRSYLYSSKYPWKYTAQNEFSNYR